MPYISESEYAENIQRIVSLEEEIEKLKATPARQQHEKQVNLSGNNLVCPELRKGKISDLKIESCWQQRTKGGDR